MKRWDIFCKIVDNFGDIGVCWRLARQLQHEHGLQVRLWVDDLVVAQRLMPSLDVTAQSQMLEQIEIAHWHVQADFTQAADVVIEAFACALPAPYLTAMQAQKSKWINLEYLSAESWVVDFHAKPSPKQGLTRYFYFPGFVEQSGGLIREHDATAQHDNADLQVTNRAEILQRLQLPNVQSHYVSLFCYPHAPISHLLDAMSHSKTPVICVIPESSILPAVADFFGVEGIKPGDSLTKQQLKVHVVPFLSQADYDDLLRVCDINFVRGEDSWVRAIWAAKPFIWQPYLQEEQAHLVKLEAFLSLFYAGCSSFQVVQAMYRAWASAHFNVDLWDGYIAQLNTIRTHTRMFSHGLTKQADLARQLIRFCQQI